MCTYAVVTVGIAVLIVGTNDSGFIRTVGIGLALPGIGISCATFDGLPGCTGNPLTNTAIGITAATEVGIGISVNHTNGSRITRFAKIRLNDSITAEFSEAVMSTAILICVIAIVTFLSSFKNAVAAKRLSALIVFAVEIKTTAVLLAVAIAARTILSCFADAVQITRRR